MVSGRKGQCGDCQYVHLNSPPGSAQIADRKIIEQEACPGRKRVSWPLKIGRLARRLRMEFALGRALDAAGCGNLFSHLTTARAQRSGCAICDAQEALSRGAAWKKDPATRPGPFCRDLPQAD